MTSPSCSELDGGEVEYSPRYDVKKCESLPGLLSTAAIAVTSSGARNSSNFLEN